MSKSSKEQIRRDEQKVLEVLKINANKSINEIANDCNFSRQKVWRIIKNFEKSHGIWGYTAIVNEEMQGLKSFIILIERTNKPFDNNLGEKIISRGLELEMQEVDCKMVSSLYIHGQYSWLIRFTAASSKQAVHVCELLRRRYADYIKDILLLETVFPVKIQGIANPEIDNLKEFII
jgi:DNA-binding Lrp family transcriptional regulator